MHKGKIKNIVYSIGKSLGVLGLIFVFYKLSQEYTFESFIQQFILLLDILPLLILLNLASLLIGIYSWHQMLLHYATRTFPYLASYYYFSKTEIAKYLPGNVFHFVGRQILAGRIGIKQTQMAKISIFYSLFLLTSTLFASTIFALFSEGISISIISLMGLASVVSFVALVYLYPSFTLQKKIVLNLQLTSSIALQGFMLGMIVFYQSETFSISLFFQCVAIYTVSWLIGFVTPGASGGIGIREGIFIAIATYLHINITEEIIIFSILLVRLINICVDVIMYFSTMLLEKKMKELKL